MKKLLIVSIFILTAFSLARATPPLDRYGGHYDVDPDTFGIHYHFYVEPDINDFEYRAMLTDIFTLYDATDALSECSRWKVLNVLLELRIDPYITYPPDVFRSSVPFDLKTLNVCKEGESFYQIPTIEAESATLTGSWSIQSSSYASRGEFISASLPWNVDPATGTARFLIEVTSSGTYQMWTRTSVPGSVYNSLLVAIDTSPATTLSVSTSTQNGSWQWTLNPQTYDLGNGLHYIWFWDVDPGVGLDKFILIKEPEFIP